MEALGEMVADVGLSGQIQDGLNKSKMKPPSFPSPEEMEAKKGSLSGGTKMAVYKMPLGKYCLEHFAIERGYDLSKASSGRRASSAAIVAADDVPYTGGAPNEESLASYWAEFAASKHFEVLAKYLGFCDNLQKTPVASSIFDEARALGKGAFGAVFLVFHKQTGFPMAVKKMKKRIGKQNHMLKDILIEREVLAKVQSRFCVSLYYAWQDETDVALVITLMPGGDLEFLMSACRTDEKTKEYQQMDKPMLQFYIASMALGIEAVHNMGYVYRDLKPMNCLLDATGQLRVSDMGLTCDISKGPIKQCSGTRGYWSPETIQKQPYSTEPDWWSLGVTAFVLFCHKMPFHGDGDEAKDAASCAGVIDYKHGEPEDFQGIVNALCTIDMGKRLKGCAALRGHSYFSDFDWDALEQGKLKAPFEPNVNDINAPSSADIAGFKDPKDVEWGEEEKAKFKDWEFFNAEAWQAEEAPFRIKKFKELKAGGGGGGGGCCTIA